MASVAWCAGTRCPRELTTPRKRGWHYFRADRAWLYVVVLTIGYLVSRKAIVFPSVGPHDRDRRTAGRTPGSANLVGEATVQAGQGLGDQPGDVHLGEADLFGDLGLVRLP